MDARDNNKLYEYEKKKCPHCEKYKTFEGHDGCLGELIGIVNACCNHGVFGEGVYVQFFDGTTIHGEDAIIIQEYINGTRGYLPGHWNFLQTRQERESWLQKMLAIDKTDEKQWITGEFISRDFARLLHTNMGFVLETVGLRLFQFVIRCSRPLSPARIA